MRVQTEYAQYQFFTDSLKILCNFPFDSSLWLLCSKANIRAQLTLYPQAAENHFKSLL